MKTTHKVGGALVLLLVMMVGCNGPERSEPAPTEPDLPAEDAVTYHGDLRPLLEHYCTGCHREGGAAPFELTSYQSARQWADASAAAVRARQMPPFLADESGFADPGDDHAAHFDVALDLGELRLESIYEIQIGNRVAHLRLVQRQRHHMAVALNE